MKIIQKIVDGTTCLCIMSFGLLCIYAGCTSMHRLLKGASK